METGSKPLIYDLTLPELTNAITSWGEPGYRARQVWHWIYHGLAQTFGEMTDLPRHLRRLLDQGLDLSALRAQHNPARQRDNHHAGSHVSVLNLQQHGSPGLSL